MADLVCVRRDDLENLIAAAERMLGELPAVQVSRDLIERVRQPIRQAEAREQPGYYEMEYDAAVRECLYWSEQADTLNGDEGFDPHEVEFAQKQAQIYATLAQAHAAMHSGRDAQPNGVGS